MTCILFLLYLFIYSFFVPEMQQLNKLYCFITLRGGELANYQLSYFAANHQHIKRKKSKKRVERSS